ncbi:hypothetical protein E2562_002444 [Oryza meyeriana var. granulata]|uniref:Uncharacterized protein n=1 Tax=Oryza meyeriana var. granulata TaxID=110450 RepID=A0A6G1F2F2_9ORYZ|nr:hypothetical protein E2562_002444 [Oryza meyeriana var. granulata]
MVANNKTLLKKANYPQRHGQNFQDALKLFANIPRTKAKYLLKYTSAYNRIGSKLIFGKIQDKVDFEKEETRKKIRKFKESAWKSLPGKA